MDINPQALRDRADLLEQQGEKLTQESARLLRYYLTLAAEGHAPHTADMNIEIDSIAYNLTAASNKHAGAAILRFVADDTEGKTDEAVDRFAD